MSTPSQPVLVTGLPRSGTTWLARQLARSPATALPGREPMNPRAQQFGLGGTLQGWTRLGTAGVTPDQRRTLQRVYRGREPRVYSRYGVRQWRAPLPSTRLVVKDPFALLSLPAITELTWARPVVLFRHPGALLASYRRMGWSPAVREIAACLDLQHPSTADEVGTMAWFWSHCYDAVLQDTADSEVLFVDHAEVTRGGEAALRALMDSCGIPAARLAPNHGSGVDPRLWRRHRASGATPTLHNFDRTAADVVDGWRASMPAEDAQRIDEQTAQTWARLRARRHRVGGTVPEPDDSTPGRGRA